MKRYYPDAQRECENFDREIWSRVPGDYYSPSIHVTQGGHIGINVGGLVIVKSVEDWHALAQRQTWLPRDKYGWPVETIRGRPIQNVIRLILHTNIKRTWQQRHSLLPNRPQ